jgi:hypothetical protein
MHTKSRTASLLAVATTTLTALVAPGLAGAASSSYHPKGEARHFHRSAGGWQGSTSSSGPCIPGVTCPTVTNDYAAHGGAGGPNDGYLRTRISSLLGAQATSRGIYHSPPFRYKGVGGKKPDGLSFRVKRRSTLANFLAVTGNSAQYSVDLVDLSKGGDATSVIHATPIGNKASWRAKAVSLAPGSLTLGDRYRIRITSKFVNGVNVVPGGGVGYDDVVLRAKRAGHAHGGHSGAGLGAKVGRGLGPAAYRGHHLSLTVKCPRSVRPHKCRMRVSALLRRGGRRVTNVKRVHVGAGKKAHVRLRVKHAYRNRLAHRRRIVVMAKVKAGHQQAKVIKTMPLEH